MLKSYSLDKWLDGVSQHLAAVLAAVFVFRMLFLFSNGLDLLGDESYYWDWSRVPDWCYYSKPPMVAWLIGLATFIGGDATAVVRIPAVVLGTVSLACFYATAKRFYSPRAGALAVLFLLATPFNVLSNFVMTIDPPLGCFWIMTLYYWHKAMFGQQQSAWFWAGWATAAAVLSKQAALLLPLSLLVFFLLDKQRRRYFKREVWIYLTPVIVSLAPILLWNQQHDWVMFDHSKGHFGFEATTTMAARLGQAGSFVLYQLLLVSPVLVGLVMVVAGKACWLFRRLTPQEQLLTLTGPVMLFGILALGLVQKVQGNWPIPFYFSALILLSGRCLSEEYRKWVKPSLVAGYGMVAATYFLPLLINLFNLHNTAVDPTFRFRHWSELAAAIDLERPKAAAAGQLFILTMGHRFLASELAFYLPDQPKVYRYEPTGRVVSQYEVWPGPVGEVGNNAFIVSEQDAAAIPAELKAAFGRFYPLAEVAHPTKANGRYHLFMGEQLKVWPPRPLTKPDKLD